MRKITNVLRELRDQNRRTQEYMASRLGISQSQYNKIEKGDKPLDFDLLANMAKIFNISPKQLYQAIYEEETPRQVHHVTHATPAEEAGESQDTYYRKMASYFEKKFLKTYRMYIEIVNKYQVDMSEAG
jgi:transcriptional regulator with XRE-family HTH domain